MTAVPETVRATLSLPLNRADFPALVSHLKLPPPSRLSPLPELCEAGARGVGRPIEEVLHPVRGAEEEVLLAALTPLAVPDRIVDLRAALFNSAPTPCRLYSSRREKDVFVGLRSPLEFDRELVFPLSTEDLEYWLQLQLQFSSGLELPLHEREMSGEQLAFLTLLVDAYKMSFASSFQHRSDKVAPVPVNLADLLKAQDEGARVRDRRWLSCALNEILSLMMHVGGASQVRLPILTREVVQREADRYAKAGWLKKAGADLVFTPGPEVEALAADLVTWISLVSLHDLQVIGGSAEAPEAREELLLFIPTGTTVWTVVSEGLTRFEKDLAKVKFGLRSLDVVTACEVARAFLRPADDAKIPEAFYSLAVKPAAAPAIAPMAAPASGLCVTCQSPLPPGGVKFCPTCGTPAAPPKPQPNVCSNPQCRMELPGGAKFCISCGQKAGG